jgi:hypothetical protein
MFVVVLDKYDLNKASSQSSRHALNAKDLVQ